ncbi:transcription factor IIIA-like [Folsomia candida]|uniref:transcription factor IIIA-like n=1 Tax=Folsomia candida TaxID=158441 RepID=UPI0016054E50|nr:transcription factor IIIA-like [Folsomia candida]
MTDALTSALKTLINFQICKKLYTHSTSLEKHIERSHATPRARVSCSICHRTFSHSSHLLRHKRSIHAKVRPCFPCTFDGCQKRYRHKADLGVHVKIHRKSGSVSVHPLWIRISAEKATRSTHWDPYEGEDLQVHHVWEEFRFEWNFAGSHGSAR